MNPFRPNTLTPGYPGGYPFNSDVRDLVHRLLKAGNEMLPTGPAQQGALRLVRMWRLKYENGLPYLRSGWKGSSWVPGKNEAECKCLNCDSSYRYYQSYFMITSASHDPVTEGSGGFYGFYDFPSLEKAEGSAIEAIRRCSNYGTSGFMTTEPDFSLIHDSNHCSCWNQWVVGTSLHFGDTVWHQTGARSSAAVAESVALTQSDDFNLKIMELADRYNLNVITLDQLSEMAIGGLVDYQEDGQIWG